MKCCRVERDTPYCSQCGKQLTDDPVAGIISHIQGVIANAEKGQRTMDQWDKVNECSSQRQKEHRETRRNVAIRKLAKYRLWIRTIETLSGRQKS